jgi:hypothetical protein
MRRSWTLLVCALGLMLLAPRAMAETPKSTVQVLAIMSDRGFEQAQALTIALKRAVTRAEGWSLAKGDFSLEVLSAAMNCPSPPDEACLRKIQVKVGAKRFVWGTLDIQGKEAVAQLRLWEDNTNKRESTIRYSANLTDASDDTLLTIAENAFAQLTGAAHGVLVVNAGNVSGQVYVGGQNMGTITDGRTELNVPAGQHEVRVVAAGYNDAVGTVEIRPGASAELTLQPTPVSGRKPDPGTVDPGPQDTGSKTSTQKIIGYAGLGVGGVIALVGGYFWIQTAFNSDDDAFVAFKEAKRPGTDDRVVGPGQDACDVAKTEGRTDIVDFCDDHSKKQMLAWVLTPIGLAIAGVGAYFLLTDDSDKREGSRARRVTPLIGLGPRGGELHVHVTF